MTENIRVIKFGGSLLSRSNWRENFLAWHEDAEPRPPAFDSQNRIDVLIVGGGEPVNALRRLADQVAMDDSTAHWIAIEFMSANARLVADRLNCPLIESLDDLKGQQRRDDKSNSRLKPELQLLAPTLLLESHQIQLEESWNVTSDSIAAAVAAACRAKELVLLKSKSPPTDNIEELAKIGYVDAYFPTAIRGISQISFVAL